MSKKLFSILILFIFQVNILSTTFAQNDQNALLPSKLMVSYNLTFQNKDNIDTSLQNKFIGTILNNVLSGKNKAYYPQYRSTDYYPYDIFENKTPLTLDEIKQNLGY